MNGSVKRAAKAPALLILAGFIIVVAGMKAASSILVPFFLAVFIEKFSQDAKRYLVIKTMISATIGVVICRYHEEVDK